MPRFRPTFVRRPASPTAWCASPWASKTSRTLSPTLTAPSNTFKSGAGTIPAAGSQDPEAGEEQRVDINERRPAFVAPGTSITGKILNVLGDRVTVKISGGE